MKNVDYESFIPYIDPPELKDHAFLSGLDSIRNGAENPYPRGRG